MRSSIAGALAAPGFTAPAWVDGAFALGYIADGSLVWGMEYGAKSAERGRTKSPPDLSTPTDRIRLRGIAAGADRQRGVACAGPRSRQSVVGKPGSPSLSIGSG